MLRIKSLLLILISLWFWSCDRTVENPEKIIWGETEYYTDFLFKKYEPVIMTQTLEFEFNDDAKRLLKRDIVFEAVEKNEQDEFVKAEGINLYKNGELCSDNLLKVKPNEQSIELGIEFTVEAREGNHTLFLRMKDTGGLDRIDDVDLSTDENAILAHEWVVEKDDIYNPLAKGLFIMIVFIIIFLVIWRMVIRPLLYDTFKVRSLYILCPESPMKTVKLKGCHKVVCSKRKNKQSIISSFFKGKVVYVQNSFWVDVVEFTPRSKKRIKVSIPRGFTINPVSLIEKGTDCEIINSDNKITEIKLS